MGRGSLHSSDSGQDPVAGSFKHSNVPSASIKAGNLLTSWSPGNGSKPTLFHGVSWSLPIQLFVQGNKRKEIELHCFPRILLNVGLQNTASSSNGFHECKDYPRQIGIVNTCDIVSCAWRHAPSHYLQCTYVCMHAFIHTARYQLSEDTHILLTDYFILHVCSYVPSNDFFPWNLATKILLAFYVCCTRNKCHSHLIFDDLFSVAVLCEE
jgi:hypothetical protein